MAIVNDLLPVETKIGGDRRYDILNFMRTRMPALQMASITNGIVARFANQTTNTIFNRVRDHFGFELEIHPKNLQDSKLTDLISWIRQYSKTADRIINAKNEFSNNRISSSLMNISLFFKVDKGTFVSIKIGSEWRAYVAERSPTPALMINSNTEINSDDMLIYIFGRKSYKWTKYIFNMIKPDQLNGGRKIMSMFKVYGDEQNKSSFSSVRIDVKKRDLDTLFFKDGVKEEIINHIDNFISNMGLYDDKGVIYKTGILLYGEPGTGKSSIIKALASKYNYDPILVDMPTFAHIDIDALIQQINADVIEGSKYMICLEDIDCIIADRENENVDKEDKALINKLLQLLDSNSSPNSVIFIATTNHIELLDKALLREGRFDLKVRMDGIHKDKVIEMAKSFNLTDSRIIDLLKKIADEGIDLEKDTIRQSKLQAMILKYASVKIFMEEDEDGGAKE